MALLLCSGLKQGMAQSLQPSVINAAGGSGTVGTGTAQVEVFYNIGEPVSEMIGNGSDALLTQGFLQPDIVGRVKLAYTPLTSNESCLNKSDGKIMLSLNSAPANTDHKTYIWSPATVCPTNDCASVSGLAPGSYSVTVYAYNAANAKIDSVSFAYVISASSEACDIVVYTGLTPNGDGKNDFLYIENIESFTDNKVYIYNRWGNKLWETSSYNNQTNYWSGQSPQGGQVPAGTYFYIIELNAGKGLKKGWIEVTTN